MNAANLNAGLGRALSTYEAVVSNPGTGNTLDLSAGNYLVFRASAGTYKLPAVDELEVGKTLTVVATGAVIIQNAAATTVGTLATGESGIFVATTTSAWSGTILSATAALEINTAADVPYTDPEDLTTASNVEDALTYLLNSYTTTGFIDVPLSAFREVDADGDVGDITANGGVLASDTTPVMEAVGTTNAQRLRWATGNADRIAASVACPPDFDGDANATVEFVVNSGTADSFNTAVLVTNWDGGADVTDALTDTATTVVKIAPGTVAAADIPDTPLVVTVSLTPPAHATDALHLYGCRIRYTRAIQLP
jgi:hypothetical protein